MSASDSPIDRYAIGAFSSIGHKLYLDDDSADFHFIFESNGQIERIPVHKIVLRNVSDVFRVMFNGSWWEKVDVKIVDASAGAFKEFLQFFYLSEAKLTSENVAEVMNLGKKYDAAECFDVCGQFLKDHLTDDDIFVIYDLASHLEHKELEIQCIEYIQRNAKAILTSENFLKYDPKVVHQILQMDTLWCPEVEIFEALMKWMNAKIEPGELTQDIVQSQFNGLLREIRFESMTLAEFTSFNSIFGAIFTLNEYREIIQMINSEQFHPKIFKPNCRNNFRSVMWNEDAVLECNRFIDVSTIPYFIKNIETTSFTVNKSVALGRFTCTYIHRFADNNYQHLEAKPLGTITIFEVPDPENLKRKFVLYKEKQMFENHDLTRVYLPKTIVIRPGIKYEIQIEMQLPSTENWCTRIAYKQEVHIKSDISVKFHNDPIVDNEARGLIYVLLFNEI